MRCTFTRTTRDTSIRVSRIIYNIVYVETTTKRKWRIVHNDDNNINMLWPKSVFLRESTAETLQKIIASIRIIPSRLRHSCTDFLRPSPCAYHEFREFRIPGGRRAHLAPAQCIVLCVWGEKNVATRSCAKYKRDRPGVRPPRDERALGST